jgi:hypothetical protein
MNESGVLTRDSGAAGSFDFSYSWSLASIVVGRGPVAVYVCSGLNDLRPLAAWWEGVVGSLAVPSAMCWRRRTTWAEVPRDERAAHHHVPVPPTYAVCKYRLVMEVLST